MQINSRFIACALASLLWTTAALASDSQCDNEVGTTRPSTPDREFIDMDNGVVQHARTGLQWSRCAVGQTWSAGRCQDAADVFSWKESQKVVDQLNRTGQLAGHTDWRLPTVEELATLIEKCRKTQRSTQTSSRTRPEAASGPTPCTSTATTASTTMIQSTSKSMPWLGP